MSHVVSIKTQVKDALAVAAACQRLQLLPPEHRTVSLYEREVSGLAVQLLEWRYPVVCDTARGEVYYDNFAGHWGDEMRLHQFLQAYAVEKAVLEARRQGYSVQETLLEDGSIRLQIGVT